MNLSNNDFIRTTEKRHKKSVEHLWKVLEDKNEIYLSKYSGWYSVSDEAFYSNEEIEEIEGIKKSKSSTILLVKPHAVFSFWPITGIGIPAKQ